MGAEPKGQELVAVSRTVPDCSDMMGSLFSPVCHSCLDPMSCAFCTAASLFRNIGAGPSILGINAIKPNVCTYFSLACGL